MPPRGTTGRSSSSTGARGPTGPKGQARSSPAGNRSGAPGSVTRGSKATGFRGPTGPMGQSRRSPGGSGAGPTIRTRTLGAPGGRETSTFPNVRSDQRSVSEGYQMSRQPKSGPRGPTGPKGEVRGPVGRNAPTGRRGPIGPKGEPRAQTRSMVTGAGKRFGPMSNDVIDIRKRQGPIDPASAFQRYQAEVNRRQEAKFQQSKQKTISTQAGRLSKTGAQYGPMRAKIERDINETTVQRGARSRAREDRPPVSAGAQTQRFRQEVSRMLPNMMLPSRMNRAAKALGTSNRARNPSGNALYGNPPTAYKSGGFGMSPTRSSPRNKRGL